MALTHDEILAEFRHRAEVLRKAAQRPKNRTTDECVLMNGKARAYDEVIDFLENNAEWI